MQQILLIEDCEDDRILFGRALAGNGVPAALQTVNDGPQAINYLEANGKYADRSRYPFPHIIVCDLRMPGDGFEFLAWRKKSGLSVPVVILEGSGHKKDQDRARVLGCDFVYEKPTSIEGLAAIVKEIVTFCLKPNEFPQVHTMTDQERDELQTAILTVCDPRGNWHHGWSIICHLANMDPANHPPPFQRRTEADLTELGREDAPFAKVPRTKPPASKTE